MYDWFEYAEFLGAVIRVCPVIVVIAYLEASLPLVRERYPPLHGDSR